MADAQIQHLLGIIGISVMKGYCTPLKWDLGSRRFYLYCKQELSAAEDEEINKAEIFERKVDREKIRLFRLVGIHKVATLILLAQVVFARSQESRTSAEKILRLLLSIISFGFHAQLHFCEKRSNTIAALVNGLLEFAVGMSTNWKCRARRVTDKVNIFIAMLGPSAIVVVPVGFAISLHWFNPYKPTLIGYWMLSDKESLSLYGVVIKLGMLMFNYWFWTVGELAALVCIVSVQILSTILLRDCIHTFWNVEVNDMVTFCRRAKIYRQIQLLGCLQNEVQAEILLPVIMFCLTLILPTSLVLVIQQPWTHANMPTIILFSYVAGICAIAIVFILGGLAGVWSDSKTLFENLDRLNVGRHRSLFQKDQKWQQKFWRSCRNLIKVKCGMNNFIEEQTPLNCLNWVVALTVQLLLVQD